MNSWVARALVFGSSGAVLVLEILAGRILAPYVGVSLETFTGIIGVVLAGIAVGASLGGWAGDRYGASRLVGPMLIAGGLLTWLSLPISRSLGNEFGDDTMAILVLSTTAFFLPAASLSAVPPMVVKLRLRDLESTGTVVGGLSAAGTVGALAGTFLTGFVLISALSTTTIVVGLGAGLVALGVAMHWRHLSLKAGLAVVMGVAGALGLTALTDSPCDHETDYACVTIEADPANSSGRSLILDRRRHAYVDLDDATNLDIRYIRLFADVADSLDPGPLAVLHLGGGGFSFPEYLQTVRPGGTDLVIEIDADLVEIARTELGLVTDASFEVQVDDARLGVAHLPDSSFDLVVGDAFSGSSVPWHLTTEEFLADIARVLEPGGIYMMNVIDGGSNRFARAEAATLATVFDHVAVILPNANISTARGVNQVFVASREPLPALDVDPVDGALAPGRIEEFIAGAEPLRDNFAPVDQLLRG